VGEKSGPKEFVAVPPRIFTFAVACLYSGLAVVGLALAFLAHQGAPEPTGLAVGILPLSPVYNLVHLVIGLCALLACMSMAASVSLARGLAIVLGFAAVVGLLPPGAASGSSLGLISTDGIWLHAVTALLAAYVGFAPPPRGQRRRVCGAAAAA
jgi:hypothetical protein